MKRLGRAAASLVGLAGLVVGIPALLIAVVGWPLPHGLPTPDAVGSALGDGWRPDERFVLGLLAILVWLLWAQLLRHVVSEFRVQRQLRSAAIAAGDDKLPEVAYASAPRHGLAPRLAGWLIGGLMMATPLASTAAIAAPSPRIPVVLMATNALADPLAAPAAAPTQATAPSMEQGAPTYVVHTWAERRDCLWNIAERYLGDPFRWSEIRDLNAERVQHDGRRLGDDPSNWVYPGWELVLPADATGADVVPAQVAAPLTAPGAPQTVAPQGAPASASPAETATASPPTTAAAPVTTAPAAPDTAAPTTPAPTAGAAQSAPPPAPPSPRPASPPGSGEPASTRGNGSVVSVNPWALRAAMAAALGLPVFALAGWLARLRRGRAAQASRARPGREVVRPEPDVEPLERAARAIAADETEEWIDAALRALTAALGEVDLGGVPELRCVRAGDMGLEVLLAQPFPGGPPGWDAVDGGYVWRLDPDVGLDELVRRGADHAVLTPAVVSLGASPEGPILADLEGFGALSVEGDADRVRAFLAGAALELTTASWSRGVELRVYGLDGFGGLGGVAASDGAELVREATSMARLLGAGPESAGSMLGARAAAGADGEPWYPMVVLVGPEADATVVAELVAVAGDASGVAVAGVLGPADVHWQLVVAPDGAAVLKPLDMGMRMAGVTPAATDLAEGVALATPLSTTDDEAPATPAATGGVNGHDAQVGDRAFSEWAPSEPAAEPVAGMALDQGGLDETAIGLAVGALVAVAEEDDIAAPIPLVSPPRARRGRLRREQDCEVWVSILGRAPRITGTASQFTGRRRLTEVLVYLAVYGAQRPVHGEDLRTHCWPPKLRKQGQDPGERPRLCEVTAESFHQAMSRLRATLGEGARGWHVPPAVDGAYAIGPGVGCDWTLFRALADAGAQAGARQDTARGAALYREALELVEGEPFADVPRGSFAWAESGPLVTDIRLAVAKVAHELATLTRQCDPNTALWATQQGLLLLPTQLCLFDAAMAASAELGDVAGIEQALAAKCWAHAQLDPDGGVPPETNELYRHLLARAKEATSVRA